MNCKRRKENRENGKRTKKTKTEEDAAPTTKDGKGSSHKSACGKCSECKKQLDSPQLIHFAGDPPGASEELITLTDPRLSLHADGDLDSADVSERPQHRVTHFSVYDKLLHLCAIDTGLVEDGADLYFSGYVKPIDSDDPSPKGGVPTRNMGPIKEWWVSGYDGGEKALIGFSTPYADYILMVASEMYAIYMKELEEKICYAKIVIERLMEKPNSTFEDLMNTLETTVPLRAVYTFNEESLLRHAQFVVEQVNSWDLAADEDDAILTTAPCIRVLISLSKATLGRRRPTKVKRSKAKRAAAHSLATTTPLVRSIFKAIFVDQLDADTEQKAPRSKRLGVREGALPVSDNTTGEVDWMSYPFKRTVSRTYYSEAIVNKEHLQCGDFVLLSPSEATTHMAKIKSLFETSSGQKMFHALFFERGSNTVLGDTSDPHEVFGTSDCDEYELSTIKDKCTVFYKAPADDWCKLGGTEKSLQDLPPLRDEKTFFYQKWYDEEACRFEDVPEFHDSTSLQVKAVEGRDVVEECVGCIQEAALERGTHAELVFAKEVKGVRYFSSANWLGSALRPGDCVYLMPPDVLQAEPEKDRRNTKQVDERTYPEVYRKTGGIKKGDVPKPFQIGCISKIFQTKKESVIKLTLKKFYRPEDIKKMSSFELDLNVLYFSREEMTAELSEVQGKCHVVFGGNLTASPEVWSSQGPDRFYFHESYDGAAGTFAEPPAVARELGRIGKGGKGDVKEERHLSEEMSEELHPAIANKLKTLDVFAGCGGLSRGFHAAGISEPAWAIEKEEAAAQAFRLNFPTCEVFSEDCNDLLKLVMEGTKRTPQGQALPQKGDVECIAGGPPCQGFSGLNRFNSREYSCFKNSLVATFLSYCDFYRPRFFVLENVRNFVSFKRGAVLQLTLRCLLRMGYQCTFAVLQAGNYGVPQTRRRAIIVAAAPGEVLPRYPQPTHVFSRRLCSLSVGVDHKKYESSVRSSAPYRTVTVRDAISDLPEITNGAKAEEMSYNNEALSHFQRKMRGALAVLRDHTCKDASPLAEARMRHIPTQPPGADWRDLPNLVVKLSDGTFSKRLSYTHHDEKNGLSPSGALRGVCTCAAADGAACDPSARQVDTLVPWSLPHTGNRHRHWSGIYGRLEMDGFFSTTLTNPVPMGKQGRVLHPEQSRLVSVRECARSQGFPDSHRFFGTILDKHRQVGNAVPPPLAEAIGMEIKKSVALKEKKSDS